MLLHPKYGHNLHACFCPRCGGPHEDKASMGIHDYVDTCPKCQARYYGGHTQNKCVKCGEPYTTNAAYAREIWRRRTVGTNERIPARTVCEACHDFLERVRVAAIDGGIGVRCTTCGSEHVLNGDTQLAKAAREKLNLQAPEVAFAKVSQCFNCAAQAAPQEQTEPKTH